MELELTDWDLPTAIENSLTLVRERAGRRGIALHQAVDQRLGQIRGDERKIKQVLLNLLSNALKFTSEGGRVHVRASASDGMAEVSVTDTGIGVAPEDQEAIFEEFRQVGTADKKVEGTRTRAHAVSEVHRIAWRTDLGPEPGGRRLDVHVHDSDKACRLIAWALGLMISSLSCWHSREHVRRQPQRTQQTSAGPPTRTDRLQSRRPWTLKTRA